MKYKKGRIWASVGYPESLPSDWLDVLRETGLQIAISPLHDKDLNPDNSPKKPHYHIIFNYDGPTTFNHVNELCKSLNMTIPIKLESLRGMYRYHIHLDNPEKYQYDDRDRLLLNGFDSSSVDSLTSTQIDKITSDLLAFIDDNNILEYSDFLYILRTSDLIDYLTVAKNHTILFNTYIKSKRHKLQDSKKFVS